MRLGGRWFKDEHGRTLILRGVNLGGSSKVPYQPDGATSLCEGFFDHRNVSFVGRPFPLAEADEHLARLRRWGFTFLRFLITWEAIEHAGPGQYDEAYLDYVACVVEKAGEYGIHLFIDPHQDVWSRFSGGDGAPGWTFEMLGMDITRFAETGAAIVHATHGDPFPRMIWPTNYGKLAAATMFTLFFGGNAFAPRTLIDRQPVQEVLQGHYVEAVKRLAERLRGLPNVAGYGTMNEPSPGFIGCPNLSDRVGPLSLGDSPTGFQTMLLGAGFPQQVATWKLGVTGMRQVGSRWVNPDGLSLWRDRRECIWKANGVWTLDDAGSPRLLRPDHFAQVEGHPVDYHRDCFRPFAARCAREIRSVDPGAIIFLEGVPGEDAIQWTPADAPGVVHAAHWYDGMTLMTKRFIPWLGVDMGTRRLILGRRRVRRSFAEQLARIRHVSLEAMGDVPTLIGEFGIPFDMNGAAAYRSGDFSRQVQALDASFRAMEENLLSCTLWNYTADNTNERGDQWNGEDLSIFSRDQQDDPGDIDSGGRGLAAAVRPYARAVSGEPLRMAFDLAKRCFELVFRHDESVQAPTEIFVPRLQYPRGYAVEVSDGTYAERAEEQLLVYHPAREHVLHTLRIRPRR